MDGREVIVYTPDVLRNQRFVLSPETQANTSRAERALVRMEDKALNGHVSGSLRRVLSRLEAISTIRIEGKAPRLVALLQLEACAAEGDDEPVKRGEPFDFFGFENEEERQTAVEVLFFERALEHIYGRIGDSNPFDTAYLLDIHSIARFGCSAQESGVGFRRKAWISESAASVARVYEPPGPEAIEALVEDLVAFGGHEAYSPITQAALAHFQFESIKPFKSGMDKTGRLMCHAILHRRGLTNSIIAPIGLEPAIDTPSHARSLLPYNFGCAIDETNRMKFIDQWVDFCALSAEVSARAADVYLDAILKLKESWLEDFGKPNKGSALEDLFNLLPGTPILTVKQAAVLTGKSLSAVNDALLRLERAGIVKTLDRFQRGRLFVARRAVDLLEDIGRRITPEHPIDRDSLG
ncbi:Fic family protein [Raoultibacter phocaeensis]|uniref:Fic family protein n=1 Tax=Raoultibacter phocaeensis TaxID=2479841 RepID=UPI0011191FC5|nr:Fic family protein [Raoultibacter phocaeensis]